MFLVIARTEIPYEGVDDRPVVAFSRKAAAVAFAIEATKQAKALVASHEDTEGSVRGRPGTKADPAFWSFVVFATGDIRMKYLVTEVDEETWRPEAAREVSVPDDVAYGLLV